MPLKETAEMLDERYALKRKEKGFKYIWEDEESVDRATFISEAEDKAGDEAYEKIYEQTYSDATDEFGQYRDGWDDARVVDVAFDLLEPIKEKAKYLAAIDWERLQGRPVEVAI